MEPRESQILICQAQEPGSDLDWLDQSTLRHPAKPAPKPDRSAQIEFSQIENYIQEKTKVPGGFLDMDRRDNPHTALAYLRRLAAQAEPVLNYEEKWLRSEKLRDPKNPYVNLGLADVLMSRAIKKIDLEEASKHFANLSDPQIQKWKAESKLLLHNAGADRPLYAGSYFPMAPFYDSALPPVEYYAGAQSQAALRRINYDIVMSTAAFRNQQRVLTPNSSDRVGLPLPANDSPNVYPLPNQPQDLPKTIELPPLPEQTGSQPEQTDSQPGPANWQIPNRYNLRPYGSMTPTKAGSLEPIWQDPNTNIMGKPQMLPALQPRFQNRLYTGPDQQIYNRSW